MDKQKLYLSTIDPEAADIAEGYGIGLELAEYCTAWNMDDEFDAVHPAVTKKLARAGECLLHGPYNELFPCAIDRQARALAAKRYRQAIDLAKLYGAKKVILHGGYNPWIYYPVWYVEQSIKFWKEFLREDPGVEIVLENVLETEPQWLVDIVRGVDNPRLRLCLDVGHVNAYSKISLSRWLESWAPWLSHFHIHNNDGTMDRHAPLNEGTIDMEAFLHKASELCPDATYTFELPEARSSMDWLREKGVI